MKSVFILAFVLVATFTGITRAATELDAVQAQVKGFYHWYVHELNHDPKAEPRKSGAIHQYITKHFLDAIAKKERNSDMDGGGLDYDPFIMAQDWDKEWERNIRIKNLKREGQKWRVQLDLSGKEMNSHRLNLVLVTEEGLWKIDKVSDGDAR